MTISLYDLGVPTFLQTMRAVSGVLDRAARHCAQAGVDPDDLVLARLHPDMAPFHFQIEALKNRDWRRWRRGYLLHRLLLERSHLRTCRP